MKISHTIFALILLVLTIQCNPVAIDPEIPDVSKKIAIHSEVNADSTWRVWITKGIHILDRPDPINFDVLPNATVEVWEDGAFLTKLDTARYRVYSQKGTIIYVSKK